MSRLLKQRIQDLVIASAGTTSNVQSTKEATTLAIYGPAALTGTVKLETCTTEDGTFCTQQTGGSDISIGVGKCVVINPAAFSFFRLKSDGAEGAARTFLAELGWENR